ncbi:protein of unknown function [Candidatus Nitrosocaldus cavascurensis]|uniref:Uncharacterized protein n=1 Tax=Candidatus Nitrosocaldus cavascurensis TaxID=2058097 RepID=A0A2K5ARF5_9ARCH|nr:protein of unknown function [Candidatus Nitrosocaldus cavascurensis]
MNRTIVGLKGFLDKIEELGKSRFESNYSRIESFGNSYTVN